MVEIPKQTPKIVIRDSINSIIQRASKNRNVREVILLGKISVFGIVLLTIAHIIDYCSSDERNHLSGLQVVFGFVEKLCEHIGFAMLVAVVVAYVFDKIYHDEMFISPIKNIQKRVKRSSKNITLTSSILRTTSDDLKTKLIDFTHTLATTEAKGIVAIYKKGDKDLKTAVQEAIANAEEYVFIQGHTFQNILVRVPEPDTQRFGIQLIVNQLRRKNALKVKICLLNTFDEIEIRNVAKRHGLTARETLGSRISVLNIFYFINKLIKSKNTPFEYQVSLRLTQEKPMYGILITEEFLFLEYYTPNDSNNPGLVFKIKSLPLTPLDELEGVITDDSNNGLTLHQSYVQTFNDVFYGIEILKLSNVLKKLKQDNSLNSEEFEFEDVLNIAKLWDDAENAREEIDRANRQQPILF